jgi:hypothetical protein
MSVNTKARTYPAVLFIPVMFRLYGQSGAHRVVGAMWRSPTDGPALALARPRSGYDAIMFWQHLVSMSHIGA